MAQGPGTNELSPVSLGACSTTLGLINPNTLLPRLQRPISPLSPITSKLPAMASELPPDLFDATTIVSLLATVAIVAVAYLASRAALPASSRTAVRFLFIWHLADALCHFILEGSFLYHCFFSFIETKSAGKNLANLFPTPFNYLGYENQRIYGPQSAGANPFAQLWMVYARADKRWGGIDLVRGCGKSKTIG